MEYSYAKYASELVKICHIHKFHLSTIGHENFERIKVDYPIYRIILNSKGKINFAIVAGLHGDEIASSLSILELLKKHGQYLYPQIKYIIYPLLGPTAFDLRTRDDDDEVELNILNKKTLRSKNYREVQIFFKDIANKKFHTFLDLHEDIDEHRFYAYAFEKKPEEVYRKIIKNAALHCQILRAKKIYGDLADGNGLIINNHDQSLEDRMYSLEKAKISVCTETPGKLDIKIRIKINLDTIKTLSKNIISDCGPTISN